MTGHSQVTRYSYNYDPCGDGNFHSFHIKNRRSAENSSITTGLLTKM